ncbi:MAG: PQQ-binding-like beta-propeller repeat protein [Acidobacteria bacterium]|nr:PQQ-binding-like beta-propeller repeat protein [Acidobacteriota bacterium]
MKWLLAVLVTVSAWSAESWPQFRGVNASGVSGSEHAPLRWNGEKGENVLWKTAIPGLGLSSPVVFGDRIYLTSAISADTSAKVKHGLYGTTESHADVSKHQWKVYAIDRKTGKIAWEQTAAEGLPKTKRHPKSTQANCTPATDGQFVVAYFGSEGLYVYTVDGKLQWKKDLGIVNAGWFFEPDYEWGAASSPIIHNGNVIVQVDRHKDSFIAAYRLKDGVEAWRTARAEIPTWGTPTIVESKSGVELVTNGTKAIRGYDPKTGKELWSVGPNSEITVTTPIFANDLIFVSNSYPPSQKTYAIKPGSTGDLSKETAAIAWSKPRGVYMPTPLAFQDQLYIIQNNGILNAYAAKTGDNVYQQRITQGGAYSASPIAAAGRLYLTSEDGDIHVIKAGSAYELLSTNPMGEVLMATPALADGVLYVRGMQNLFAIAEKR